MADGSQRTPGLCSKPPAVSTVLHSCGSFAVVGDLRGLLGPADGCIIPAIASPFSTMHDDAGKGEG